MFTLSVAEKYLCFLKEYGVKRGMGEVKVREKVLEGKEEYLVREAETFIRQSFKEFDRGVREKRLKIIRDAAEKAWLAVVKAIESLLLTKGFREDEIKTYRQKRLALDRLSLRDPAIEKLGLRDRFVAREYNLHIRAFYDGEYDVDALREEIKKAEKLIEDISSIIHGFQT